MGERKVRVNWWTRDPLRARVLVFAGFLLSVAVVAIVTLEGHSTQPGPEDCGDKRPGAFRLCEADPAPGWLLSAAIIASVMAVAAVAFTVWSLWRQRAPSFDKLSAEEQDRRLEAARLLREIDGPRGDAESLAAGVGDGTDRDGDDAQAREATYGAGKGDGHGERDRGRAPFGAGRGGVPLTIVRVACVVDAVHHRMVGR